jgi:hypothetical protein
MPRWFDDFGEFLMQFYLVDVYCCLNFEFDFLEIMIFVLDTSFIKPTIMAYYNILGIRI